MSFLEFIKKLFYKIFNKTNSEHIINEPILDTEENDIENSLKTKMINSKFKNVIVILDPGHGSTTIGKRSPAANNSNIKRSDLVFYEYEWNRIIVKKLASVLNEDGIEVSFTVNPENNSDLGLSARASVANAVKADNPDKKCVFISVHANAAGNGNKWMNARGWSVYTTKGQNNSDKLGNELYLAAEKILLPMNQTLRKDTKDGDYDFEENFTVIYKANMPAVLTENLFYDNIEDTEFLLSDIGQNAIVEIHRIGIENFIEKYY